VGLCFQQHLMPSIFGVSNRAGLDSQRVKILLNHYMYICQEDITDLYHCKNFCSKIFFLPFMCILQEVHMLIT
jgi:hypothetical protein